MHLGDHIWIYILIAMHTFRGCVWICILVVMRTYFGGNTYLSIIVYTCFTEEWPYSNIIVILIMFHQRLKKIKENFIKYAQRLFKLSKSALFESSLKKCSDPIFGQNRTKILLKIIIKKNFLCSKFYQSLLLEGSWDATFVSKTNWIDGFHN